MAGAAGPRPPNRGVNILHEGVEMHPQPRWLRRSLEEEIHEHRLAAANAAIEVDPAIPGLGPPSPAGKYPSDAGSPGHGRQPVLNDLELLNRGALRVVITDRSLSHQAPVAPDDVFCVAQRFPADEPVPHVRRQTTTGTFPFEAPPRFARPAPPV